MTYIDIFSGFLGAGKTTLIRKLIETGYKGEKLVLIENEFGDIAIDGGFLQDAGIEITEMNSGCICCTLVGDFTKALKKVIDDFAPDRILIEPSGVGKLSDVAAAVGRVEGAEVGTKLTVVDAVKAKMYQRNFGEFFEDQVANADLLVLSRTDSISQEKLLEAVAILKALNQTAGLITTPWDQLSGEQIIEAMRENGLHAELSAMEHEHHHHHHHHDGECDDPECECHHHHEHGDHDHHHHHHADEVFSTWGVETPKKFDEDHVKQILGRLEHEEDYGRVLRAKGILASGSDEWIYFDYVPGEISVRHGSPQVTGRLCVIGTGLKEDALKELFTIG